jgi:glutaredoxin-like protein NrdH
VVQVYGKEECVQCKYTVKKLDENGIPYQYHDITKDDKARKIVEQSGRTQLPYVVPSETDSWHGFRPDHIKALT